MVINIRWTPEEIKELERILHSWEGTFPGYKWAADKLNDQFNNNRSIAACRQKAIVENFWILEFDQNLYGRRS